MRGYFGIGVERISKPMNAGSVFRTANAFGASFIFTLNAHYAVRQGNRSDTSHTSEALPFYEWDSIDDLVLPKGCRLVGVEFLDDAVELPRYRHPSAAAYVLGPERGSLSQEVLERCDEVIKIPTRFCINVALAGALVMYDRLLSSGRFGERPVVPPTPTQLPSDEEWVAPTKKPHSG